ncbi:D-galactoside/L-rhamnose binding SUEL lectin domain [Arabidopsis thaliana x Arabidopsis arenosa]|uniref:D-galactoside/L-rhamnose binding SUEL lectin domain n=1 Tax=Arabidopsis thaliana x Arabidopsis arenosa TaxID=1240361 RepID=A0A8T1ZMN7_9BRAS|nr:D-galactoside/L-rhamnose binding SUEL lectin domain [Arabidopsis thaliana x Arabidopsis arenosa]
MGDSHCRCLHRFILLVVMFLSSVFTLASKIDVSFHGDQKGSLSSSINSSLSESVEYTMCANHREAKDGKPIALDFDCERGYVISKITYADYGQSTGSCGNFKHGNCGASNTLNIVKKKCLRKEKCKLFVPDKIFGPSHCKGALSLVIDATCRKT